MFRLCLIPFKDFDKFMNCVLMQAVMQATTMDFKWGNMVGYGENNCYTMQVSFLKSKPKPHPGGDTYWQTAATSIRRPHQCFTLNTRAIGFN